MDGHRLDSSGSRQGQMRDSALKS